MKLGMVIPFSFYALTCLFSMSPNWNPLGKIWKRYTDKLIYISILRSNSYNLALNIKGVAESVKMQMTLSQCIEDTNDKTSRNILIHHDKQQDLAYQRIHEIWTFWRICGRVGLKIADKGGAYVPKFFPRLLLNQAREVQVNITFVKFEWGYQIFNCSRFHVVKVKGTPSNYCGKLPSFSIILNASRVSVDFMIASNQIKYKVFSIQIFFQAHDISVSKVNMNTVRRVSQIGCR